MWKSTISENRSRGSSLARPFELLSGLHYLWEEQFLKQLELFTLLFDIIRTSRERALWNLAVVVCIRCQALMSVCLDDFEVCFAGHHHQKKNFKKNSKKIQKKSHPPPQNPQIEERKVARFTISNICHLFFDIWVVF